MSDGAEMSAPNKGKPCKKAGQPRVHWGIEETWALIRLWEDRMDDLRRVKRNGSIYAEIAASLQSLGYDKTQDQVHNKIENLGNTYR